MKKTKFLLSVCMAAALFVSQSAWAAAGERTQSEVFWELGQFNDATRGGSITDCQFIGTTDYVTFNISGDKCAKYEAVDLLLNPTHYFMAFSKTKKNETSKWNLTWSAVNGAKAVVSFAKTHVKVYNGAEWNVDNFKFSWNVACTA